MTTEQKKKSIPVIEGLFTWPSDNPQLLGTKCESCGTYYFPKRLTCANPKCKEKKVGDIKFSTRGKLYSFTNMRYPPTPPFKTDQKPPYPVGLVEFPEGIRILGFITGTKFEDLKPDMEMKLVFEPINHTPEGQEVIIWKFAPIK